MSRRGRPAAEGVVGPDRAGVRRQGAPFPTPRWPPRRSARSATSPHNPDYGVGLLRGAAGRAAPSQVSTPDDVVDRRRGGHLRRRAITIANSAYAAKEQGLADRGDLARPRVRSPIYGPVALAKDTEERATRPRSFISFVASKKGQAADRPTSGSYPTLPGVPEPDEAGRRHRSSSRTGPSSRRTRTRYWRSTRRSSVASGATARRGLGASPVAGGHAARGRRRRRTGGAAAAGDDGADGVDAKGAGRFGDDPEPGRAWVRRSRTRSCSGARRHRCSPCRSGPPLRSRSDGRTCLAARCCASGVLLPVLVPDFVLAYSWLRAYGRRRVHRRPARPRPGTAIEGPVGVTAVVAVNAVPVAYRRRRRWAWRREPSRRSSGRRALPAPAPFDRAAHDHAAAAAPGPRLRGASLVFVLTLGTFAIPLVMGAPGRVRHRHHPYLRQPGPQQRPGRVRRGDHAGPAARGRRGRAWWPRRTCCSAPGCGSTRTSTTGPGPAAAPGARLRSVGRSGGRRLPRCVGRRRPAGRAGGDRADHGRRAARRCRRTGPCANFDAVLTVRNSEALSRSLLLALVGRLPAARAGWLRGRPGTHPRSAAPPAPW